MYYENLPIVFTDDDRGIQYEALASGECWPAERATGPSYSSGGEPGCDAGCEVSLLKIESFVHCGNTCTKSTDRRKRSEYAIEVKPDGQDVQYRGWCEEVLEDCQSAIEDAFMQAASGEVEGRKSMADDARYEELRERRFLDRVGIA